MTLAPLPAVLCAVLLAASQAPAHHAGAASPPLPSPDSPAPPVSMMASAARAGTLSAQILWVDATANAGWLDSVEKVREVVGHCQAAGINGIVVDVKPLSGQVLYDSRLAPRMTEWKGKPYPAGFDLLQAFIEAGRGAGIPVYADMNTFAEGHKTFHVGPAYAHEEWQVVSYDTAPSVMGPAGDARYPIARDDEPPARDEIAAFTPASGPDRPTKADEFYAAYDTADRVVLLADGSALGGGRLPIPKGGGLLAGRGAGRDWLLRNAQLEQPVRFTGESRLVPAEESRSDHYAVFVNPILPEVQRREIDIAREIVSKYPVRGIFFDRMRYPNLHADFSDASRSAFERWLGRPVERWPQDIVSFPARPGAAPVRGPLFKEWLEWRAHNIHDFLQKARRAVRSVRHGTQVGVYVGSWYASYYDVGVNWGSPAFPDRYDWMTPTYPATGYAPLLDLICAGTYFPTAWKADAAAAGVSPAATVEGSAEGALAAVRDETMLYGSLYLIQYQGHPEAFRQAIRASLAATGGVMIFDLSYLESYGWWKILEDELPKGRAAPHLDARFVRSIRSARHAADAVSGARERGRETTAPTSHPPL